ARLVLFTTPLQCGSPRFPYTTLFRSRVQDFRVAAIEAVGADHHDRAARQPPSTPATGELAQRFPDASAAVPVHHRSGRLVDGGRSEEHTSELQSRENLVCRLLLEKKK